jgi:UDP-N-acetylmuramate-alanine ligase
VVSAMPHPSVHFIASLEETTKYLLKNLRQNDVLIVLSAGDADQINVNVLAGL